MKSSFRTSLYRILLLVGATAILLLLLPKADHQSYSFEQGQPWKYPLLTADFDMPIMRDSASATRMRDSIDQNFIPFVKRDNGAAKGAVERFRTGMQGKVSPTELNILSSLLTEVYADGILPADVYAKVRKMKTPHVRVASTAPDGGNIVVNSDAEKMLSPAKAYEYVDSAWAARVGAKRGELPAGVARALNICLQPDVTVDSVADNKFRSQEYLNVTGALGVIKKGQRIVDRGEIVTAQIYTNLVTYQEMLEKQNDGTQTHTYYYMGQALYILLFFSAMYLFLALYRDRFFKSLRKMSFLMVFITLFTVFAIIMFEFVPNGLYLVPFAAVPVIVLVFFDSRTAIISLIVTVMLSALVATYQFQFIVMELLAGLFATYSIRQLSKRSQLLRTALVSFGSYVVSYFALLLLTDGDLSDFSWRILAYMGINAVILSFAYVLIFLIEKCFGFTSTVTLVELSDINNPVLRRLAEEAPGTFQHSMQVSSLAAEAARAIGANATLVRTGALYHDIGKLESPIFFTENQHGINPHTGLNPETSAQKIISHVPAGVAIASKAKLPSVIKDFIREHHGRSLARYFYNTAVNEANGAPVDPAKFRYPGPDPQSKETAILMMADSVEAASRSLKDYSPQAIDALVDKIVDQQVADGRFREAPISFRDVETVKDTFKKRLATIYHSRIAYPEIKGQGTRDKGQD